MENLDELERQQWWDQIEKALDNEEIDHFRAEFLELHPYDQAQIFIEQSKKIRMQIYTYLSPDEMAEVFENIELDDIDSILTEMEPRFAADILAEMALDDAVDILNSLEQNEVASFLAIMNAKSANEIKDLLHYEEKTSGSIMTTEFVRVKSSMTIREALNHLRKEAPDAETIYYVYVIDDDKHLVGVISLRDIIISEEDWYVSDVMSDRIVSVPAGEDQESAAKMMRDYDLLALPVVDFQNHLLGIITVDDIMDVIQEEASEDYSKLAAVSDMDKVDTGAWMAAKKRLPWLIILLFLGMLTASLIGRFEETLDKVALLAIFIPLIAGMAGNTGTQALAVAVRGIATGESDQEGKLKILAREAGTGLITGLCCGVLITVIIYLWKDEFYLGLLVGISIMLTLIVATLAGSLIPLLMHKMKVDPAVASGPFITTINDIISILIYFGMATAFMDVLL
ncbi:magnesium transporter [Salinibacillus xinjiangensis]|uniref:Magnesium transporter MgtE n=1 Tax=Salinibacillus xinjiangensis TaxID=1229268 RepID=A0A6G1X860_9BACI|nr:magnesium transporter [Salinibacillus xinjiangensis]MRG87096.1 magnesium transporter [Salinibacillus xinjiangensis]